MKRFFVRLCLVLSLLLLPKTTFGLTGTFYPEDLVEVKQSARSITTIISSRFPREVMGFDEIIPAGFGNPTPVSRNLQEAQMKTVLIGRMHKTPRRIADSIQRRQRVIKRHPLKVNRPRIRGKNIGIIRMRIGNKSLSFDAYIQNTRRFTDFG